MAPPSSPCLAGTPQATPSGELTILQKVMPQIVAAVPKGIGAVTGAASGAVKGLLSSGSAKSLVSGFADRAIVNEAFLGLSDLDLPKWASWLATGGYTDKAGWKKIAGEQRGTPR